MLGTPLQIIQWLYGKDNQQKFEIKEHREKRSLTQNAYAWKLITEIGNVVRLDKEDVYFNMLKHYGQSEVVSILSEVNPNGYFKYYEELGTGIVKDKEFTHYKIYKGSSEFDSREMSIFIDGVIQECNQLGIDTLTTEEIRNLEAS